MYVPRCCPDCKRGGGGGWLAFWMLSVQVAIINVPSNAWSAFYLVKTAVLLRYCSTVVTHHHGGFIRFFMLRPSTTEYDSLLCNISNSDPGSKSTPVSPFPTRACSFNLSRRWFSISTAAGRCSQRGEILLDRVWVSHPTIQRYTARASHLIDA